MGFFLRGQRFRRGGRAGFVQPVDDCVDACGDQLFFGLRVMGLLDVNSGRRKKTKFPTPPLFSNQKLGGGGGAGVGWCGGQRVV